MNYRSIIRAAGAYLPERIVTNDELATRIDTSDEWIRRRTGIGQRHIAADNQQTCDLAFHACRDALQKAGVGAETVDAIVLATATADHIFPATATRLQAMLGAPPGAVAFDVQAACSGFAFALTQADNMIRLGQARRALVVGAEIYSRILDWEDRGTCVLFGDGAGALVLDAVPSHEAGRRGVLSTTLGADGTYYDKLYVDGGVGSTRTVGHVRMEGREVFRHAVTRMWEGVETALQRANLQTTDIDWLVPHQANIRIMTAVGEKLGLPAEKLVATVERHANISAATIPVAMEEGCRRKLFKPGDIIALTAMGGGFTWGAAIIGW